MIGIRLNQAKSMFFDTKAVMSAAERGTQRVLSKFGAFVWRKSRQSIRKRNRVSTPGQPPSGHGEQLLKKNIFFMYERARQNVIIGPILLNGRIGDAPAALEHGGTTQILAGPRRAREIRRIEIEQRPYMGPAFQEVVTKELPDLWKNSIRKGA